MEDMWFVNAGFIDEGRADGVDGGSQKDVWVQWVHLSGTSKKSEKESAREWVIRLDAEMSNDHLSLMW